MKRLLSIELQKIWKNRASRILTITYFLLLTFLSFIASIKFDIGPIHIRLADQGIFDFPFIWHFNTFIAAFLKIFLAVIIVSMMANEYSYGTLKQNLIDGLSKKEFILSKFLVVGTFAVASTLFVFVMSLILGYSFSSYNEMGIVFSDLEYLLAFFVKLTAFFSFCLFLGILVKRSAFALGFLFIWFIGENIFYWLVKFVILGGDDKHKNFGDTMIRYFPMESMSNLIKEPFTRLSAIKTIETTIGGAKVAKDYSVHFSEISIALLWAFIFILTSYYILKKRDL